MDAEARNWEFFLARKVWGENFFGLQRNFPSNLAVMKKFEKIFAQKSVETFYCTTMEFINLTLQIIFKNLSRDLSRPHWCWNFF